MTIVDIQLSKEVQTVKSPEITDIKTCIHQITMAIFFAIFLMDNFEWWTEIRGMGYKESQSVDHKFDTGLLNIFIYFKCFLPLNRFKQ